MRLHEAIRPTILMDKEQYNNFTKTLNRKEEKVFMFIMITTLASFMKPPCFETVKNIFVSSDGKYSIQIDNIKIKHHGYIQLLDYYGCDFCYNNYSEINSEEEINRIINNKLKVNVEIKDKKTKPKVRLTEK